MGHAWWLIPLGKWVLYPSYVCGVSRANPLNQLGKLTHIRFVGWAKKYIWYMRYMIYIYIWYSNDIDIHDSWLSLWVFSIILFLTILSNPFSHYRSSNHPMGTPSFKHPGHKPSAAAAAALESPCPPHPPWGVESAAALVAPHSRGGPTRADTVLGATRRHGGSPSSYRVALR